MRRCQHTWATLLALPGLLALASGVHAHPGIDERIEAVSARLALNPGDAELFLARAELHRQHDDRPAALADYAAARRLDPGLTVVDLCLGQLHLEQGEHSLALVHFDAYLATHPDHADAHALRGRARSEDGDATGAAADFSVAIAASPRPSPDLWIDGARALASLGGERIDEALSLLDAGLSRLGPVVSLQAEAVDLAVAAGRLDQALARLEALARDAPRPESWLLRRAGLLAGASRRQEAAEAYRATMSAIERLPRRAQASLGAQRTLEEARRALASLAEPRNAR